MKERLSVDSYSPYDNFARHLRFASFLLVAFRKKFRMRYVRNPDSISLELYGAVSYMEDIKRQAEDEASNASKVGLTLSNKWYDYVNENTGIFTRGGTFVRGK